MLGRPSSSYFPTASPRSDRTLTAMNIARRINAVEGQWYQSHPPYQGTMPSIRDDAEGQVFSSASLGTFA